MTINLVNIGTVPNDNTGDPVRTAFQKINNNFSQLAPVALSGQYASLLGTPSLAKVALTGQYSDLLNLPVFGLLAFLNTINNSNWLGAALTIGNGGTGQTTKAAAFNALSPMVDIGDTIIGLQLGQGYRLPVGANGQVYTVANGIPSWADIPTVAPPVIPPGPDEAALVHYGVASGINVLSSSLTPALTSYKDGILVQLLITQTNTSGVVFNANGFGPISILKPDGSACTANDFIPGQIVLLTMESGIWQWVNYIPPVILPSLPAQPGRLLNIIVVTGSSVYTPSVGSHSALVLVTGGGGAGGGGGYSTAIDALAYGGGGGESGTTIISYVSVSHSSPINCTIGAAGVPVNSGPRTQSGSGGTTSFGSYGISPGGKGGYNVTGADDNPPSGSSSGATYNVINMGSNPGQAPFVNKDVSGAATGSYNVGGGMGGASFWGGAGAGLTTGSIPGFSATGFGSGGGGCPYIIYTAPPRLGGYGGNGVILILEFS